MEEIKEEGRPYWVQAKKELFSIQNYIDLAEKGLVKKNDVIAEFNNTIGKVIGKSNSFDDVKKRVENSGDAYVEFVFNKACADIANRRAAEAAYKK